MAKLTREKLIEEVLKCNPRLGLIFDAECVTRDSGYLEWVDLNRFERDKIETLYLKLFFYDMVLEHGESRLTALLEDVKKRFAQ